MTRLALVLGTTFALLPAPAAFATCAMPGIGAYPETVRAGAPVEISLAGGTAHLCNDTVLPPGSTPSPTPSGPPPVTVRVTLTRAGVTLPLGTLVQDGYGARATFRVPRGTAPGSWTLRTSTGLVGWQPLRVTAATLPRTGRPTAQLAATGTLLLVLGGWVVAAESRRRRHA
jgi:hypothetical protein